MDRNPSGRREWRDEQGRIWKARSGGEDIGRKRVELLLSRDDVLVAHWEVPKLTWHADAASKRGLWESLAEFHDRDGDRTVRATEWTSGGERALLLEEFC